MTSQPLLLEAADEPCAAQRTAVTAVEPAKSGFSFDVAVVGLGYVGLPTALAFHAAGMRVLGVDVDAARIDDIRCGSVDALDDDLARLHQAMTSNDLTLDTTTARLRDASAVIICVPTPVAPDRSPDLAALTLACQAVVANAVVGQTLILTSTTYVGSTRQLLADPLLDRGLIVGVDVFVAFSPERIDPGNDRHRHEDVPRVVGGLTANCVERATAALAGYARRLHAVSSAECAEFTKLHENTFRAVNIAFANEMSVAAHVLGLDITEIIDAASTKPYGFMPFMPGPGVGGHCIPCDPQYLLWQLHNTDRRLPLVEQAMELIEKRPLHIVERVRDALAHVGRELAGSELLVVGVAYKPNVQDVRESSALVIIEALLDAGACVTYFDPYVPRLTLRDGRILHSVSDPADGDPDVVLLHTAHANVQLDLLPRHAVLLNATYRQIATSITQMMV
jgi:nucleotide sugar dehydrogenase